MWGIGWFFIEKNYIRYPLEVLCFLKGGESLFSRKQEKERKEPKRSFLF